MIVRRRLRSRVTSERTASAETDGSAPAHAKDALGRGRSSILIRFAGIALTLDHRGALYLPEQSTLIVSDLHLEKGSNAAARGRLIPALDSHDTLIRMESAIKAYRPARVVCLGDSFHDGQAGARMAKPDRAALASLCSLAKEWVWIGGNHDPEAPAFCEGERLAELEISGLTLRHEPGIVRHAPEIVGHFHPKVSVPAGGCRFSGRCFCVSDDLLIMPAFGAYAGGLSCTAPALRSLHKTEPRIIMLHASKLWRVA
jgi:hypothetical protein